MSHTCPECGAPVVDGMSCWDRLGALIALEYQDPELQAVHFLTVAGYNLQHPAAFTDEAVVGLRDMFIRHLDEGLPLSEIRARVADATQGSRRVMRPGAERHPVLRHWGMTFADVYLPDHPEGAAERVRRWAASIRHTLQVE